MPPIPRLIPTLPARLLSILAILLVALWFRIPRISEGLPYFYQEDEAHHFNRVVEMVKNRDLNPHYFNKPSLHFYLRMPVVVVSYLWSVHKGYLTSIKEIRTRDPFGIASYAFTASHPGIVKWNRTLSVALSLGLITLLFLIVEKSTESWITAGSAALLLTISPEAIKYSAIIGVDGPMAFFCLASMYFALFVYEKFSLPNLTILGLIAGLAVSCKYNAAPIACLPLFICYLKGQLSIRNVLNALVIPGLGFLLGSPYILVSIPQFIENVKYEIWHYGVAGHVGHEAEPGLAQALFYLNWLHSKALGVLAVLFAGLGIFTFIKENKKEALAILIFPALYAFLMINQKANFERNMLVIIPCVALLSASAFHFIAKRFGRYRYLIHSLFLLLALIQPSFRAVHERFEILHQPESRNELIAWLKSESEKQLRSNCAVAGQLQLPIFAYKYQGVQRVDQNRLDPAKLAKSGKQRLVLASYLLNDENRATIAQFYNQERIFAGVSEKQREMQNPQIETFTLISKGSSL